MRWQQLYSVEDFEHGDLVYVISYEENCGIDKGSFKAIVVDSKEYGLILVPENIEGRLFRAAEKGTIWEILVDCLLKNDVEVYLLSREL